MKYKVVKFHKKYIPQLKDICERVGNYQFPDLTSPLIVIRGVVIDENNNIVGGGFIKLTAEAIIMVEPDLSLVNRARIVDRIFDVGLKACFRKGFDTIHAFIYNTPTFVTYLQEKLGFNKSEATVLYRSL